MSDVQLVEVSSIDDCLNLPKHTKITFLCKRCNSRVERLWSFNRRAQISKFLCKRCSQEITSLEKYGCLNWAQNEDVKKKLAETNLRKYGNKCSLNGEEQISKKKETWKKKFWKG